MQGRGRIGLGLQLYDILGCVSRIGTRRGPRRSLEAESELRAIGNRLLVKDWNNTSSTNGIYPDIDVEFSLP